MAGLKSQQLERTLCTVQKFEPSSSSYNNHAPLLLVLSSSLEYNPSCAHTSSSVLRMFILPLRPPVSRRVLGFRRVTRLSISFHIGCNSSSESITCGSLNFLSSCSSCFFRQSFGLEDEEEDLVDEEELYARGSHTTCKKLEEGATPCWCRGWNRSDTRWRITCRDCFFGKKLVRSRNLDAIKVISAVA